jgi:hypothetical protein
MRIKMKAVSVLGLLACVAAAAISAVAQTDNGVPHN